jgi:hypothetical protein
MLMNGAPNDPAKFPQWKAKTMLAFGGDLQKIEAQLPKLTARDTGGSIIMDDTNPVTRSPTAPMTFKKTATPGEVLTDQRSREVVSATMSKPFEVTGPDGLPVLVQQDKQGNIKPVQGYTPKTGSSKPLTDAQAKALLFGTRMQEANKVLESVAGQYFPAAVNAKVSAERLPLIGGAAGMAGNAMLSAEAQQAEQAQRDFINAVLRRESGAVISDSEFANANKQYFPQPNDKPGTLAQKKRNRELAISGLLAEVPEGRRQSITPAAQPDQPGPKFLGFE